MLLSDLYFNLNGSKEIVLSSGVAPVFTMNQEKNYFITLSLAIIS